MDNTCRFCTWWVEETGDYQAYSLKNFDNHEIDSIHIYKKNLTNFFSLIYPNIKENLGISCMLVDANDLNIEIFGKSSDLEDISDKYKGKYFFYQIDIDSAEDIARKYNKQFLLNAVL